MRRFPFVTNPTKRRFMSFSIAASRFGSIAPHDATRMVLGGVSHPDPEQVVKQVMTGPALQPRPTHQGLNRFDGSRRSEPFNEQHNTLDLSCRQCHLHEHAVRSDRRLLPAARSMAVLQVYDCARSKLVWWVEELKAEEQYSKTSLAKVPEHSPTRAGIHKPATLHWLSLSYPSNFLEGGTELRDIQENLGCKSSKTIEISAHVREKSLQSLTHPMTLCNIFDKLLNAEINHPKGVDIQSNRVYINTFGEYINELCATLKRQQSEKIC